MRFLLSAVFMCFAGFAMAEDVQFGQIVIKSPHVYETVARAGGGFMEIHNMGDTPVRLIDATSDQPRTMIHKTVTVDGVAKMMHQEFVEIPAGESVVFQRGGLHVMYMGLTDPWVEGQQIHTTLIFEEIGEVDVTFDVVKRPEMEDMEMGHAEGH